MVTSIHSGGEEQVEGSEPGDDGYWPALEILKERKHDYLVNWDGVDPETGKPWTPSWTRKVEVTEDLIEVWEAKKALKKKKSRRATNKPKKPRVFTASTPTKPVAKSSRSSRTSRTSNGRATDSPVISLTSDNGSRMSGEPALGKRKRRTTRNTPADEDPKPVFKKQRVDVTPPSTFQKSRATLKQIGKETIREEEEEEDPVKVDGPDKVPSPRPTSKAGAGSAVLRIGPPRRHKKAAPPPSPTTPPPPRRSNSFDHLREEEEENTQEAAGAVPRIGSTPLTTKKKKRRLKPASDVRPTLTALVEKRRSATPSRDAPRESRESDQEEPPEADPPPRDQDDEPAELLREPTPPRTARQRTPPDSPIDDMISIPTLPSAKKNSKTLGPVPRLNPSHFKPYLRVEDTTSVIDEFSPKKSFHTQDTVEPSLHDSQIYQAATKSSRQSSDAGPLDDPLDDPLDVDIVKKMQDVQDAYFDFDGRANEVPHQEQPTTDPGSTEQDPGGSQSPVESANTQVPAHSLNSQKLEDALVILNQKSEEIEGLEARLTAQEDQIEHLQDENHGIQIECERLSVTLGVQREALEEAKGTVSELGIHIDWLQGSLDKSEAEAKQLQNERDEITDALNVKVQEYDLARAEWEQEKTALEMHLASFRDGPSQPPDWELEKKELEVRLVEVTEERDQLDRDKRYAENEVETWKEQYRKAFMHSQELRHEAKDAKTEISRVREEKAIVASQTMGAVRLVTAKYEAVVEKLKTELAKAESLYKVLQEKDEQTGDNTRRHAASAIRLQDEIHRLREELASDVVKETAPAAEPKRGGWYECQIVVNGVECHQGFDSPQGLWTHVVGGHTRSSGQR